MHVETLATELSELCKDMLKVILETFHLNGTEYGSNFQHS